MAIFVNLGPGVKFKETDLSEVIRHIDSSACLLIGHLNRGDKNGVATSTREYIEKYEEPNPAIGYTGHSALGYLQGGSHLIIRRVTNNALYAGVQYIANSTSNYTKHVAVPFTTGTSTGHDNGEAKVITLRFNAELSVGDEVTIELVASGAINGVVYLGGDVVFTYIVTDVSTAMSEIALKISDELNKFAPGFVVTEANNVISITGALGMDFDIPMVEVESLSDPAPQGIVETPSLFTIYSRNEGDWANKVGVKIVNFDRGTSQRTSLVFSKAFIAGDSFSCTINDVVVAPIVFATTSDDMMEAIANAIKVALGEPGNAVVTQIGGGSHNDREIIITAASALYDTTITDVHIIGTSPPAFFIKEILTRTPPNNTFTVEVYTSDNTNVPVESYTVSLAEQLDGFNQQQNITEVINNSARNSQFIRVFQPRHSVGVRVVSEDSVIKWLSGGDNGMIPTSGQIIQAYDDFTSRERYTFRMVINNGDAIPAVQQRIDRLCKQRMDCFGILDMPSASQRYDAAVNYRRDTLNIQSTYSGIYSPDLQIRDAFSDLTIFIPPSGYIAGIFASTDYNYGTHFAPAGLERANLSSSIIGLREDYEKEMVDYLFPNQINPIIKMSGKGYPVWGDSTLQSKTSKLSYIGVRRTMISIEVAITDSLDYSVFNPNNDFTRFRTTQLIESYLEPKKINAAINDYDVICDETNNTNTEIDEGKLNVDVFIDALTSARYINVQAILTKTGASVRELVRAAGGRI